MTGGPEMTESWRTYRAGNVEFRAPHGLTCSPQTGVDSRSAILENEGVTVIIDRGPFSDPLTKYGSRAGFERRVEQIAGQEREIVTFLTDDAATRVVAVHVTPDQARGDALTAVVHVAGGKDSELGTAIVRSIEILTSVDEEQHN